MFFNCIKQIDSMLLCVCSVTDHRGRQNVVRTSVAHSAITSRDISVAFDFSESLRTVRTHSNTFKTLVTEHIYSQFSLSI